MWTKSRANVSVVALNLATPVPVEAEWLSVVEPIIGGWP